MDYVTNDDLRTAIAPLATREGLRTAIAPLATREELRAAIAPLATRDDMRESEERTRRHMEILIESLRDDIRLLAEGHEA
jgi:DNA primase